MRRTFLVSMFIAVLFSSQAALASPLNFTNIEDFSVPSEIGKMIGDARVNIYDYDNKPLGSMVIVNGTINQTTAAPIENPTHKIFVKDAATMQKIIDADSFLKEFNRQRSLQNISIQALGFFDQIKLAFATFLSSVASIFISPE